MLFNPSNPIQHNMFGKIASTLLAEVYSVWDIETRAKPMIDWV